MLKSTRPPIPDNANKKHVRRPNGPTRRPQSVEPQKTHIPLPSGRRCQSLSPSCDWSKRSVQNVKNAPSSLSTPENAMEPKPYLLKNVSSRSSRSSEKDMPQCILTRLSRQLHTKKRDFAKMHKSLIGQQNTLLEQLAAIRELESRMGVCSSDETVDDIKILSMAGWQAYDLILLTKNSMDVSETLKDVKGVFGSQILQQTLAQLQPIPADIENITHVLLEKRTEVLNFFRKQRGEKGYNNSLSEFKMKCNEFDQEGEDLHRCVQILLDDLKSKITNSLEVSKVPWLDRQILINKIEKLKNENLILQTKLEENTRISKLKDQPREEPSADPETLYNQTCAELAKEKAARESLKEVVTTAENMLRVARTRIATLERQLKETHSELQEMRRKHKDLEHLVNSNKTYRYRESSFDARSKKLMQLSKKEESTIETLARQRDALELRVKELREQAEHAEKLTRDRDEVERVRADSLLAKLAEQERCRAVAEKKCYELEEQVKQLLEELSDLKDRCNRLVEIERINLLEYVPSKESEPSARETELYKTLVETQMYAKRVEEDLRLCRSDKDHLLQSLTKIAQQEENNAGNTLAIEFVEKERKISQLQESVTVLRQKQDSMEHTISEYERKIAEMHLEVVKLRNYDCYVKEIPYQELQNEIVELNLKIQILMRERTSLLSAAASRALMLERHERAAELFARLTRARTELASVLDGQSTERSFDDSIYAEVSRSLSSVCSSAADTWTALRTERARVLHLESALFSQKMQLEREERVRTQLERRRAQVERKLFNNADESSSSSVPRSSSAKIKSSRC